MIFKVWLLNMAAVSLNSITDDWKWDIKSYSYQCFPNNFVLPIVQ